MSLGRPPDPGPPQGDSWDHCVVAIAGSVRHAKDTLRPSQGEVCLRSYLSIHHLASGLQRCRPNHAQGAFHGTLKWRGSSVVSVAFLLSIEGLR
jgi:hypothetical protein